MAKKLYIGVNGIAREVKKIYIGVNGVAREVKKGYIGIGGSAREFFSSGKRIKELPVGTVVYFRENGVYQPYEIVNQGAPPHQGEQFSQYGYGSTVYVTTSTYDGTANGTWILRYHRSSTMTSSYVGANYINSTPDSYCQNTFYSTITDKHLVKTVNLPVPTGLGPSAVSTVARNAFVLSPFECGTLFPRTDRENTPAADFSHAGAPLQWVNPYWDHIYGESPNVNALLGHDPQDEKWLNTWVLRGYYDSGSRIWWLMVTGVNGGSHNGKIFHSQSSRVVGIRPCMVIDSDALIDENNYILP